MSYATTITGTANLLGYWKMDEPSGTTMNDSSGNVHNGSTNATVGATGPLTDGSGATAYSFNGTSQFASVALDLSAVTALTIEFWLKWTTFAQNDHLALEFTTNWNNGSGFIVDPNDSGNSKFTFGFDPGGTLKDDASIVRPSQGAWHYYACTWDPTQAAATEPLPYVDGSSVAFTQVNTNTLTGVFSNSTLYVMSRAGASLWAAGSMAQLAVYTRTLTPTEISNHFAAASAVTDLSISTTGDTGAISESAPHPDAPESIGVVN